MFILLSTLAMAADSGAPGLPYYRALPVERHDPARRHHRSAVAWSSVTGALAVGTVSSMWVGGVFTYPWVVFGSATMASNLGTALSARRYARTMGVPARWGTAAVVCAGVSAALVPTMLLLADGWERQELAWASLVLGTTAVLPLALIQGHLASRGAAWGSPPVTPSESTWPVQLSVIPAREGGMLVASTSF